MKTLSTLIKTLRSHRRPVYQQLELPLSGRELTRRERTSLDHLIRLREEIARL